MDARRIRLRASGFSLHGLEWAGRGPPVLLLHATSFCAEVWRPVWQAAAGVAGARRAIAVDQRGHGRSDAPRDPSEYAWTRLADDLVALVRALGGGRAPGGVFLAGHSSGATAALAAAGRAPDRVRGVLAVEPVLFEPPAPGSNDGDSFAGSRFLAARARRRRAHFAGLEAARAALRERPPYREFAAASLDAYLEGGFARQPDGSVALRCAPEIEAAAYEGAAALDLWPLAEAIEAPVRVLSAERGAIPPDLLARLRRRPRVRVEPISGATHFAALERPEAVGRALGRFLAEVAEDREAEGGTPALEGG